MLLTILAILAVSLTCAMFATRQAMLGFPSAIFWALTGGQAYMLSAIAWDIYFLIAFASLLGMTTFTALAAYGLREKRDTMADKEMEGGEGGYIDESSKRTSQGKKTEESVTGKEDEFDVAARPSERTRSKQARRKGEFDFR